MNMRIVRLPAVIAVAALWLGGCGVRGPLEPPPGAEAVAAPVEEAEPAVPGQPVMAGPVADIFEEEDGEATERVIESQRRSIYPPMSDSFVLDPLL
jgi:predicted small lipoprotein YifL